MHTLEKRDYQIYVEAKHDKHEIIRKNNDINRD